MAATFAYFDRGRTLCLLIFGLWGNWIPYLSDICNASTVAEAGGWQCTLYPPPYVTYIVWAAALVVLIKPTCVGMATALGAIFVAFLLSLNHNPANSVYHVPWTWLVVPLLVLLWRYLLQVLFLLNKEEARQHTTGGILDAETRLKIPEDRFESMWKGSYGENADLNRTNVRMMRSLLDVPLRFISCGKTRERRYFRLFALMIVPMSLPAWIALLALHIHVIPLINPPLIALIGLLCLLGVLSLMVSLGHLGTLAGVRVYALILPIFPISIFVVSLFGVNPIEVGQATLNQHEPGWFQFTNTYSDADSQADAVWNATVHKPLALMAILPATEKREDPKAAEPDEAKSASLVAQPRTEDPSRPLVLFCVSGGGTRAALFAAGIYDRMWQEGPDGQRLLENVDAISSVSGGSLASAYLCESLYRLMRPDPKTTRRSALQAFFETRNSKECRPALSWYGDASNEDNSLPVQTLDHAFENAELPSRAERLKPFDTNPFLNAMRQNFVAPIISGYFWPRTGRGPSYEDEWERLFQWYDGTGTTRRSRRLSEFYDLEHDGRLPVLILNSLLTRTGSRIAITNLGADEFVPLEKFGPRINRIGEEIEDTGSLLDHQKGRYDPHPGRVLTLNYLAPDWNISLKTAVRASANFPAVLPLMRFRQTAGDGATQHLVWNMQDGGGLDNYGTDTVMALLRRYRTEVCKRGVLIFQIDASFMSIDKPDSSPWIYHALEANDAVWRAGQNNDAAMGSLYLREMAELFGYSGDLVPVVAERDTHRKISVRFSKEGTKAPGIQQSYRVGYMSPERAIPGSPGFAYFKVRLGESANDQVLTFWHLNDAERTKLYNGLCEFQQGAAIRLAGKWLLKASKSTPHNRRLRDPGVVAHKPSAGSLVTEGLSIP